MAEAKKEVLQKTETKNKSFQMPELLDLLKVGAHFGHKKILEWRSISTKLEMVFTLSIWLRP